MLRTCPLIIRANIRSSTPSAAAATGFVLPGITFGITPIGFYMFSAYWGVFTAIILWGAWNKRKVIRPIGLEYTDHFSIVKHFDDAERQY